MTDSLRKMVAVLAKRHLEPPPNPPRLWPALALAQRQQLAQCLAELIRRMPYSSGMASQQAPHESP